MNNRETTEYGSYRDPYDNVWLGVPQPGRSLQVRDVYSTTLKLGQVYPYTHVVSTYGHLRAKECEGTAEDGGACIRPELHDTVHRSQPLT